MELLDETVDLGRLVQRLRWYAQHHGLAQATLTGLESLLSDEAVQNLMALPHADWFDTLVNDAYKPSMHRMYAKYLSGVAGEFALHCRRSPIRLQDIKDEFPVLWEQLNAKLQQLHRTSPYPGHVQQALSTHFPGFSLSKEMLARAEAQGVAAVTWSSSCHTNGLPHLVQPSLTDAHFLTLVEEECYSGNVVPWTNLREDDCSCIAAGHIEAASHTETSVMQLVQQAVIAAQVLRIRQQRAQSDLTATEQQQGASQQPAAGPQQHPSWPDRTELLANSLAHLGHVIDTLNTLPPNSLQISLFAGRRSSDRLFLVLQNLAFARMVQGYAGTSSVYVAAMMSKVWDVMGVPADERLRQLGPLVGTHAHETSSVMQQLMCEFDNKAGLLPSCQGAAHHPVVVSSLLAHLLLFATSGDLEHAVALPDTFSTPAWLAAALAADVPQEFSDHMQHVHNTAVPCGAKVFDLIRVWRIDSGSYVHIAAMVMDAWEQRSATLRAAQAQRRSLTGGTMNSDDVQPLPPPVLMHSNLGSVDEVLQVAALPERIRPAFVAFGSLADGFFPLVPPGVTPSTTMPAYTIKMASVVMKAVQARAPKVTVTQACAFKAGDLPPDWPPGKPYPKLEVDPRLSPEQRRTITQAAEAVRMAGPQQRPVDPSQVSAVLREAYQQVAQQALLGG